MKPFRLCIAIFVFIFALSLAGCGEKVYFFSFADEQSLSNAEGAWFPEEAGYQFNEDGVNIQDANLACPFRFSGDFTVTVNFWLNADADHDYWLGLGLGDGTWWGTTESDVHVDMYEIGDEGEYYTIGDHNDTGSNYWTTHNEPVPGLKRDGYNTYVLRKVGKNIKLSMNGVEFADYDLQFNDADWLGPNLVARSDEGIDYAYGPTFESIEVTYKGSMSPMPLPTP